MRLRKDTNGSDYYSIFPDDKPIIIPELLLSIIFLGTYAPYHHYDNRDNNNCQDRPE